MSNFLHPALAAQPFHKQWAGLIFGAALMKGAQRFYQGRPPAYHGSRASARAAGYSNMRHMQREKAKEAA